MLGSLFLVYKNPTNLVFFCVAFIILGLSNLWACYESQQRGYTGNSPFNKFGSIGLIYRSINPHDFNSIMKARKIFGTIFIFIGTLFLILNYYIIYTINNSKSEINTANKNIFNTDNQIKPSSTNMWSFYHDEKYGFEFNYPPNWYLEAGLNTYIIRAINLAQKIKSDTDQTRDIFIIREDTNCKNFDWQIGFGDAFGKTICKQSGISITMIALTDSSKTIENNMLISFKEKSQIK